MKKTLISIFSLILILTFTGSVQADVCTGDYTIDDIDTSGDIAALSGCTEITGTLIIEDTSLANLSGLETITSVGGRLLINVNTSLTSLNALSNLTTVGGNLVIDNNDALTSLTGLENITSVVGYLRIGSNASLTNLNALSNLTSIGGIGVGLQIVNNDALTSLNALSNLISMNGYLWIERNDALTSLTGLENLISVDGELVIGGNDALTSLNALSSLTNVSGRLMIDGNSTLASLNGLDNLTQVKDITINNTSLKSLSGLSNLTSIGGFLQIAHNNALTSLTGLENITSIGASLYIFVNDVLTSLNALSNLISIGDIGDGFGLYISGNDALTNLCGLYNVYLAGDELQINSNIVLSMDTANALKEQLIINGFSGRVNIHDNNGTEQVFCDNDADTVYDDTDNCPNVANPLQEDVDKDGTGDVCDEDTIYGYIYGDVQEGIAVNINVYSCGAPQSIALLTTGLDGYYAIGNNENGLYGIIPQKDGYSFTPKYLFPRIPQTEIQSYNFTATTKPSCGE